MPDGTFVLMSWMLDPEDPAAHVMDVQDSSSNDDDIALIAIKRASGPLLNTPRSHIDHLIIDKIFVGERLIYSTSEVSKSDTYQQ